jgi:hypothetical protein
MCLDSTHQLLNVSLLIVSSFYILLIFSSLIFLSFILFCTFFFFPLFLLCFFKFVHWLSSLKIFRILSSFKLFRDPPLCSHHSRALEILYYLNFACHSSKLFGDPSMSHCTWVPSFCFTYALHVSHCHIFVLYDVNCLCLFSTLSKLDLKTSYCLENWFQMNTLYHCLLSLSFVAFLAKLELCASIASNFEWNFVVLARRK